MATLTDCIILCHRCRIDQLFPQRYHENRKLFVSLVASALTDSVVVVVLFSGGGGGGGGGDSLDEMWG